MHAGVNHRILTRRRGSRLDAVRITSRQGNGLIALHLDIGTENVWLGTMTGTQWIAAGHRTFDPTTARLLASRLLDAATIAEAEAEA